jgi:type IV secretory pathway TrbF-like protein
MRLAPNPFVYIFPAILLGAVLLYYLYGAVDRVGLETHDAEARVIGKQVGPGSTTYHTTVVDGRTWSQAQTNPDAYIVTLDVEGDTTGSAVSRQLYESLDTGERVRVQFRRTRLSKRVLVTDVSR